MLSVAMEPMWVAGQLRTPGPGLSPGGKLEREARGPAWRGSKQRMDSKGTGR